MLITIGEIIYFLQVHHPMKISQSCWQRGPSWKI